MVQYDVAIIGAGPGGYSAALKLAQLGKKTVLIENHKLGGECLNYGCIPSKTIISTSNLFNKISNFNEQGIECDNLSINLPKFQLWKDSIIKKLNNGIEILCKNYNVTILQHFCVHFGLFRVYSLSTHNAEHYYYYSSRPWIVLQKRIGWHLIQ